MESLEPCPKLEWISEKKILNLNQKSKDKSQKNAVRKC